MKKSKYNLFSMVVVNNNLNIFRLLKILFISLVFYFTFFHTKLFAWHDTGHMVVASVAYKNLDPDLAKKLDMLLVENSKDFPKANNFITASVWADDIKVSGFNFFNTWHYQDAYFSDDGSPLPKPFNMGKAYSVLKKHLSLINSNLTTNYEKVFSLRFIIHIIGDMHQPMHNTSRVTKEFPRGDLGGNFFKLNDDRYHNLHSLWDSGLKSLPEFNRPLTDHRNSWLDIYTETLIASYPLVSFSTDIIAADFKQWQKDNIDIVKTYVYNDIKPDSQPSDEYLKGNHHIIQKQLTLAGYRLANALNCAFKSHRCIL